MNSPRQKPVISIDDLLRLKRAERPPESFWGEFERNLRAKQLAAIIEPRPWWAPLIRIGARFTRYQLPVGAAAILTVSFLTVREYRTADFSPSYGPDTTASLTVRAEPSQAMESAHAQTASAPVAISEMPVTSGIVAAAALPVRSIEVDPMPAQSSAKVAASDGAGSTRLSSSPSGRYMASNLAAVQSAEPTFGNAFSPPNREFNTRQTMREPLAQIAPPSESRLARLLSPSLPAVGAISEASLRSTDRVARNITEDRLYDTISRISARGAGVAVKF